MRHTFVIIDQLLQIQAHLPSLTKDIWSDVEKRERNITQLEKALTIIDEYAHILDKLIINHKVEKNLDSLKKAHVGEIDDWAGKVEDTFKKMDSLLKGIEYDVKNIRKILEKKPIAQEKLRPIVADLSQGMYMSGLHDEEEHLNKLRELELFKIHELKDVIDHEQHHSGIVVWLGIAHLTYDEHVLEEEKYFKKLLS